MENLILSHCQPLYCHKGTPYNDWTATDRICSKAESFTGLAMDGKLLQWIWYLHEFLHDQDMVAKGSVPSHTEEIALLPPWLTTPPKEAPTELWVLTGWSQHLANTHLLTVLQPTDGTKANGKCQPVDWEMERSAWRKEPQNQCSAVG